DAFDRGHRVLDEVDHVRLHDLGRGALVRHGHVDDREVDVGVLAHPQPAHHAAEAREADQAEADQAGHQHPGEHMVADGDVRGRASGGYLPGVLVFLISALRPGSALDGRGFRFAVVFAMHHGTCAEAEPPLTAPGAVCTSTPSARRSEPSTTTFSPGVTPERISTAPSPVRMPSCSGRILALLPSTT